MAGGVIDRQGLLHVGDVIKEINGKTLGIIRSETGDFVLQVSTDHVVFQFSTSLLLFPRRCLNIFASSASEHGQ